MAIDKRVALLKNKIESIWSDVDRLKNEVVELRVSIPDFEDAGLGVEENLEDASTQLTLASDAIDQITAASVGLVSE